MALTLESCTLEEKCSFLGRKYEELEELREKLKDWVKAHLHLPQEIPNTTLECFLLNTKMSLEQAKQKLDMYYSIRRLVPELFTNRDPVGSGISDVLQIVKWVALPKLTPEKYRVSILKTMDSDDVIYNPWEMFKYSFMVGDVRISECRSLGDIYIYDLSGVRLGRLAKLTPTILKKCEVTARKAYAAKIVGIHFINAPNFVDRLVNLVKSSIKPKLAERVHVHSTYDSLYEFMPKSILPADYGGEEMQIDDLARMWQDKLVDLRDWFIKEEQVLTDESLRAEPMINPDDLFGTYGSFRKLDVD